ncbi:21617_t:CDS:2 [Cetraspora pellucida]|uniref:21617_t:CDS:1 n=1 Tax=Cetraspora pellucida TaxID=1433469 RepID=A0A9N9IFJ7_9GLOM|nr:21617_t:CDS:2 [Cetraspora pellucida]
MIHSLSKQAVLKTNRKNLKLDLICCANVLQAIRYLMDDGIDDRFSEEMGIISEDSRIINIQVQQELTNNEIQSSQLTSHLDNNTALKDGLFATYNEYMGQCRYIKTWFIKLYQYI